MTELAFPKPRRVLDRVEYKRTADRKATAFRVAVWQRDKHVCRHCGCHVVKTMDTVPYRGEVHHIVRRAIKCVREDSRNGVLLCAICHDLVTHYELRIVGTKFFKVEGQTLPFINADHKLEFKPL